MPGVLTRSLVLSLRLQQRIAFVIYYPQCSLFAVQKQHPDSGSYEVHSGPFDSDYCGVFGVAVEALPVSRLAPLRLPNSFESPLGLPV